MRYEVWHRNSGLIDSGGFTIGIAVNRTTRIRNFREIKENLYCEGDKYVTYPKKSIADCREGYYIREQTGVCPGGYERVISVRK